MSGTVGKQIEREREREEHLSGMHSGADSFVGFPASTRSYALSRLRSLPLRVTVLCSLVLLLVLPLVRSLPPLVVRSRNTHNVCAAIAKTE